MVRLETRSVAGTLGLVIAETPAAMQKPGTARLLVQSIEPGTPAAQCGLELHDQLLELNDRNIRSSSAVEVDALLSALAPKQLVTLLVARDATVRAQMTLATGAGAAGEDML